MECQGICNRYGKCIGEVKKVNVSNSYQDWGEFCYCEYAIDFDRNNGFDVEIIDD